MPARPVTTSIYNLEFSEAQVEHNREPLVDEKAQIGFRIAPVAFATEKKHVLP
jgi:hypothetical protein